MNDSESNHDQPQTIGQALQYCSEALENSDVFFGHGTDNAWDEAVQMVLSISELPIEAGEEVLPQSLGMEEMDRLQTLLERRIVEHFPLPYLLGRAWFAGLEFRCDQRAIIPRSPIAELILRDFQPWYSGPGPSRVLDLCCGGGCIGLAIAHYFPDARVDLVDIDNAALELGRENLAMLGLEDRVNVIQSDLFESLAKKKYDLIVSNPPYVNAADLASMPLEYHCEPQLALGAGSDGLELARRILMSAGSFLHDTGLLIVEVGNSWPDLEKRYPRVPFTWLEFEHGGEGVFALTALELQKFSTSWDE
jgi:ribosomal protein L3 glutamine methyltransferase